MRVRVPAALLLGVVLLAPPAPALEPPDAPAGPLTLVAPAAPGGGWDQTAHALRRALLAGGLASAVEVTNSPGAGGTIGLAQFVASRRGDERVLLVGGLVMLGAIRANKAAVSLSETTPLARLTGDHQVVAVRSDSEFRTLADLVRAMKADPAAIAWGGGSDGGIDRLLLTLVAQAASVEPTTVHYVPFPGGGDAVAALLEDRVSAGVSGYAEFAPAIADGRLRALGVSSERRMDGVDVPTLREQGFDVVLANWRGVFGAPGLSPAERERLTALLEAAVRRPEWRAALREKHWTDLYLAGEPFARFVEAEQARLAAAPNPLPEGQAGRLRRAARWGRTSALVGVGVVLAVAAGAFAWQRRRSRRREEALTQDLASARLDAEKSHARTEELLRGLADTIERQFGVWGLTTAEREVAHLMLKGLKHREIADVRRTSERTVRQQALTIYKKAGLEGRTDLAAFFLEDLLTTADVAPAANGAAPGAQPLRPRSR